MPTHRADAETARAGTTTAVITSLHRWCASPRLRWLCRRGERGLDEVRPWLGECLPQLGGEFGGRIGPAGWDAHAVGQGGEVECGPGQVEQAAGCLPGRHRADAFE